MSWASAYEPMQSMQPMDPSMDPTLIQKIPSFTNNTYSVPSSNQQLPSTMPHMMPARPPVQNTPGANNVKIPNPPKQKNAKWADISEYQNVYDWGYIIVAVLIVETVVICLVRYFPDVFGKSLNVWYNRFKLSAVLADVLIILIGFGISRYVYTEFVYPNYDWNPLYFGITALITQLVHDILFYVGIIRPFPQGQNAMMDVFKDYANEAGGKILAGDSFMMIGSVILAMLLKASQPHIVVSVSLVTAYIIPYILEKRNNYSNIA
jgi:hypothetical protein